MKPESSNNETRSEVAYPIYDMPEAVKVAEGVRDLGGGNAPVARSLLAQHLKYAETGPSFFQRVAACRAFGLIDGRGSYSLTELGKQYFFPTVDGGRDIAAVKALTVPKAFSILVQKFDGGKLPAKETIGNIIHAEAGIPVSKKGELAALFLRSAQFIGAIDPSGFLRCKALVAAGKRALESIDSGKTPAVFTVDDALDGAKPGGGDGGNRNGSEQHTLYLSQDKKRVVKLSAPLTISNAEYERICGWIKLALIVEDKPSDVK